VTASSTFDRSGPRRTVDPIDRHLGLLEKARLVIEVLRTYCHVRWRLHRIELEPLLESLRAARTPADGALIGEAADHVASRLGFVVNRLLTLLPTDRPCLVNSLVLTSLLASRGIPGRLVIGVTVEPFAAHAWVEHQGQPLLPTQAAYRRLVEL